MDRAFEPVDHDGNALIDRAVEFSLRCLSKYAPIIYALEGSKRTCHLTLVITYCFIPLSILILELVALLIAWSRIDHTFYDKTYPHV